MRQYTEYPDYLAHFGIKGMKWGVRRFQNKDGSYTAAGLKRRFGGGGGGGSRSGGKARAGSGTNAEARKAKIKKAAKIAAVAAGTGLAAYGAYRLAKSGKLKGASSSIKRLTGSRAGQVVDEARRPNAFKRASGAIKGAGDKIYNRMHGVRDVKPTNPTGLSTVRNRRPNFKEFVGNKIGRSVREDRLRRTSVPRIGGSVGQKRSFRDRVKSVGSAARKAGTAAGSAARNAGTATGSAARKAGTAARNFASSRGGKNAMKLGAAYGAAAAGYGYSEHQRRRSVDKSLSNAERASARKRSRIAAVATGLTTPGVAAAGYGAYRYATRNKYRLNSDGSFPKSGNRRKRR